MTGPKVSILMTTWNRAGFIGKAIQSVIDQDFKDWGLIVADDGSTDSTKSVVAEWTKKDERIKYINPGHQGRIAKISNIGLRAARGEYIAVLDDDDWWAAPEKLKKQVEFLDKNPDYVGCGGGFIVVDGDGRETGRFLKPETDEEIKKKALIANPMVNSTTMFRRAVAEEIRFYDETMSQFADWDFWLKMGLGGRLYNFPEYFLYYRAWEGGMSFSRQRQNAASARRIVFRYRKSYPNFFPAFLYVAAYSTYAYFPEWIKRTINPRLSRLKKMIFSGRKGNARR